MILPVDQHSLDIVETLTRRVRLLSIDRSCISGGGGHARRRLARRLRRLAAAGLVFKTIANTHPLLDSRSRWLPGAPEQKSRTSPSVA